MVHGRSTSIARDHCQFLTVQKADVMLHLTNTKSFFIFSFKFFKLTKSVRVNHGAMKKQEPLSQAFFKKN